MEVQVIKTREGDIVQFDRSRIERAIEKASENVGQRNDDFTDKLTDNIIANLEESATNLGKTEFITIEQIQDEIEKELMNAGAFEIMKHFIIYRNERQLLREQKKEKLEKKLEKNKLKIVKSTGKKENFEKDKVKATYKIVSYGLARKCPFEEIYASLKKYLVEGMKTSDITKMMIKSAVDLVSVENTSWQFIAGRLSLIDLYKEASNNRDMNIKKIYEAKHYAGLFEYYVKK